MKNSIADIRIVEPRAWAVDDLKTFLNAVLRERARSTHYHAQNPKKILRL